MTGAQRRFLMAVASYTEAHGYPPTSADLAGATGYTSKSPVTYHLRKLREDGLLFYEDGSYRRLQLTHEGRAALGVCAAEGGAA